MMITTKLRTIIGPAALMSLMGAGRVLSQASLEPQADLYANFAGDWVGQLEYRDYSSNERVFLPTWLRITEEASTRSLALSYVYDDGPTKTVREHVTLALDFYAKKATLTDHDESAAGKATAVQMFDVAGIDEFAKTGRGALRLTGAGMDDGKRVDVRITITLRRNLFSYRKDIRSAASGDDKDYQFRDGYVFTRAKPPEAP